VGWPDYRIEGCGQHGKRLATAVSSLNTSGFRSIVAAHVSLAVSSILQFFKNSEFFLQRVVASHAWVRSCSVFVAKDRCTKARIDPDVGCYAMVDWHTAADVVNDLRGEIVTANRQSTKILDMMIDGRRQKNLPMAVAPLNSQRYEMILGRQWIEESDARLENGNVIWLDWESKKPADDLPVEDLDDSLHLVHT
jgi:hypothetical protein